MVCTFSSLGHVGILVKCCDLFHLALNLAEESLSPFLYISCIIQLHYCFGRDPTAGVSNYLFRLRSLCHWKGQPVYFSSILPPFAPPTAFTQTRPSIALFMGVWNNPPTPPPRRSPLGPGATHFALQARKHAHLILVPL